MQNELLGFSVMSCTHAWKGGPHKSYALFYHHSFVNTLQDHHHTVLSHLRNRHFLDMRSLELRQLTAVTGRMAMARGKHHNIRAEIIPLSY
jgi:hypothetical protein